MQSPCFLAVIVVLRSLPPCGALFRFRCLFLLNDVLHTALWVRMCAGHALSQKNSRDHPGKHCRSTPTSPVSPCCISLSSEHIARVRLRAGQVVSQYSSLGLPHRIEVSKLITCKV